MASPDSQRALLTEELDKRLRRAARNAILNRWLGYSMATMSIVSSAAAFLLTQRANVDVKHIGYLAVAAAFLTALNATFNFEARAAWFHRRLRGLRRIKRRLLYPRNGEADIPALAEELSDLLEDLASDYPALGRAEFKVAGAAKPVATPDS